MKRIARGTPIKEMAMAVREMRVLGALTGDTKVVWDPSNEEETKAAKKQFKTLTEKGFQAFRVDEGGEPGERINEFPKGEAKVILVPPIAGG